jgi:hypothetical protein
MRTAFDAGTLGTPFSHTYSIYMFILLQLRVETDNIRPKRPKTDSF